MEDFTKDLPKVAQGECQDNAHAPGERTLRRAIPTRSLLDEDVEYDAWLDECLVNVEFEEVDVWHDA